MGDGIIGTNILTLTALNALLLIDHGFPVFHGDGAPWADLSAGMCQTAHTQIGHFVTVLRTCIACGGNHLHQRRFIILL